MALQESILEMNDVTISFSFADKIVLNKINLRLGSGELVTVIGSSGSGKFTKT